MIYRSLALGPSRSLSCSFPIGLSHFVISYHCGNGLVASGPFEILFLCSCALLRPYDLDILLAWHHAPMISCSHKRGVITILHFPSPTPSCPHAPSLLDSRTCKETLPHCLASRSLIVQVSKIVLPSRREAHWSKLKGFYAEDVPKSSRRAPKILPRAPQDAPRAVKEPLRGP